ncbi:peptide deformylase [Spiroplasma corruscae]|uniref:peptide deformylase n=1 Tax=Spiroplasma corruscae TaxID=216934 RepID=UPI003183E57C
MEKDLLQAEIPTNKWLWKDTQPEVIRNISVDVNLPLSSEDELIMKKLIDFVRFSQDPIINDKESIDHLRPAVGLAAPQIGANKNMFFARFEWKKTITNPETNEKEKVIQAEEYAMVNAKITARSTKIACLDGGEGCLSVDKNYKGLVPRSYKIQVEGYNWLTKENINITLRGYKAIVFQHELDHNNGKLYYDHINKTNNYYSEDDWYFV